MANDNSDLWPADIVVDVLSPLMILNEQAESLTKRTQGIVKGEVLLGVAGDLKQLDFDLVAPAVSFRQRILRVRYSQEFPYPVVLIAAPLVRHPFALGPFESDFADPTQWQLSEDEKKQARLAHTPNEVREFLKTIFNAPATRATLFSLIARSNEATAVVKGDVKPSEEPAPKPVSP